MANLGGDGGFEGIDVTTSNDSDVDELAEAMAAIEADAATSGANQALTTPASEEVRTDILAEKTPAAASSDGKDKDGVTVEPSGVLAADGKNILPYDVLKETREARGRAEQAATEATQAAEAATRELAELRAENERLKAGTGDTTDDAADAASDRIADLKAQADTVRADLPAIAGMLDGMIAEIEDARKVRVDLEARAAEQQKQREREQAEAGNQAAQVVRAAIDSNPTLAFWEAHPDPKAYDRACDFDETLRKDPEWAKKPMADRFAKAVELTLSVMPDAPKPPAIPSAAEIAARARQAVKDAGNPDVDTLSDLPSGSSPGADPLENLANVDAAVLANRMESMSQAQIDGLLARLG